MSAKEREKLINEKKEIDDEERELSKTLSGNRIKKSSVSKRFISCVILCASMFQHLSVRRMKCKDY